MVEESYKFVMETFQEAFHSRLWICGFTLHMSYLFLIDASCLGCLGLRVRGSVCLSLFTHPEPDPTSLLLEGAGVTVTLPGERLMLPLLPGEVPVLTRPDAAVSMGSRWWSGEVERSTKGGLVELDVDREDDVEPCALRLP